MFFIAAHGEAVDVVDDASPLSGFGRLRVAKGPVGPMPLDDGPFVDPPPQQCDLFLTQTLLARIGGRHQQIGIVGFDVFDEQTLGGVPRREEFLRSFVSDVQTQFAVAFAMVGSVTAKAACREDRSDFVDEADFLLTGGLLGSQSRNTAGQRENHAGDNQGACEHQETPGQ